MQVTHSTYLTSQRRSRDEKLHLIEIVGLLTMAAFYFHLLRNLSPVYFVGLGSLIALFIILCFSHLQSVSISWLAAWAFFPYFYITLISFLISYPYDLGTGITRLWIASPMIVICSILSKRATAPAMKIYCYFYAAAALSFLWQYSFGAISWFAEATERANTVRFGSLLGSVTVYGSLVGSACLATLYYFSGLKKWAIFVILTLGAILSLQKSGFVNVVIALTIGAKLGFVSWKQLVLLVIFCFAGFVMLSSQERSNESLSYVMFDFLVGSIEGDSAKTGDVSMLQSILDRWSDLPLEAINYHGWENLGTGVGVYGGAGGLGYNDIPTAHNGLVELVLLAGYFFGGGICVTLVYLAIKFSIDLAYRTKANTTEQLLMKALILMWILNYLPTGGLAYHPIGVPLIWLPIFRLLQLNKEAKLGGQEWRGKTSFINYKT